MQLTWKNEQMQQCQDEWNKLDPEMRITMSQYDLAKYTEVKDYSVWVAFLKDPRVSDTLSEELALFKAAQQRKLIAQATSNSKSVGVAQMVNALGKTIEDDNAGKTGEIFVYSYVPLNPKEIFSPCAREERRDLFNEG